jgi:cardiolipin synthase
MLERRHAKAGALMGISLLLIIGDLVLAALFSLLVISRRREPAVTLAWILCFFFLPFVSFLIYAFFGYRVFRRRRKTLPNPSRRAVETQVGAPLERIPPPDIDPRVRNVERLSTSLTEFPVSFGNRVLIFEEAYSTYGAIAEAIRLAKHHVHLEYYIFKSDETGRYFRDLLIEQARRGVECRVLVDAVGSYGLSRAFVRPMLEAGVKVAHFWPVKLFRRSWGFHLRNHRKLAVIDGVVGFIGSQNIGNEYIGWPRTRMSWRDTHLRVEGPVVNQLQAIFIEDWGFTTRENLTGDVYFPKQEKKGGAAVQTLPTGPDGKANTLELIFLTALHAARERITLTTPYFVPNNAMILALKGAAWRGVQVDLLLPKKSDQPLLVWAARSWYRELMAAGVRIHEHPSVFIHAKVATFDRTLALVGSANMDVRSFLINFEASLLIYDEDTAMQLQRTFDAAVLTAERVRLNALPDRTFTGSLREGLARVLSPLL